MSRTPLAMGLTAAAVAGAVTACDILPPKVPRGSADVRVEQQGTDQTLHAFNAIVDGVDLRADPAERLDKH
jgi:hypothetical protein